ncbi:MAG: hypothetical protein IAE77_22570 [Prosthecobacter sp.]|nr:hypothetical protein [Prosthecobacter sp.]
MKRLWQILALLMLALMVPASMCCYGEDGCEVEACCSECHDDHGEHDGDEHHAPVSCPSDTISHSQVPAPVMLPELQMVELADIIHAMMRLNELAATTASPVPLMSTAPPELRATWHFTQRTALPVRAPSIQA